MEEVVQTVGFEKYPAYKNSGVEWLGEVPEHWEVKRVKYVLQYQKGKNPRSISLEEKGNIYLSMDFLRGKEDRVQYIDNKKGLIEVCEGDILLLWDGANAGEFIKAKKGILSSTMAVVNIRNVDFNFSWYFCNVLEMQLRNSTNGMGIPHVSSSELVNFLFLIPSPSEQKLIANFLDKKISQIDLIIAQKEQQIELLKERRQVLIHNAVTRGLRKEVPLKGSGVEWIGEIPEHWKVKRLKYVFTILKRIVGELGHDVLSITQNGIKVKDTESGEGQLSMDYSKYQIVREGDFAMNHMDLLTGYVDISNFNGVISPDYRVFNIIDSNCDKNYLLLVLQLCYKNKVFYAHGQGVSMLGRWRFPAENFNNFLFPIPPLEEQVAITVYILNANKKISTAIFRKEKEIEKLKEYKSTLINNAVTGKIKVS